MAKISRRQYLDLSLLAAGLMPWLGCSAARSSEQKAKVIMTSVGISGLAAARRLKSLGLKCWFWKGTIALVDELMTVLRSMYGNKIPNPVAAMMTRWNSDPLAHGSYSYLAIGSSLVDHQTLAEPIDDRIFFAGEATSDQHPATVHGAFLSGEREANRIAAR